MRGVKGRGSKASSIAIAIAALALMVAPTGAEAATVLKASVTAITRTTATLNASINPEGATTQYSFEYGPAPCASNPCTEIPGSELLEGTAPISVSAPLEGLIPETTYHFRVLAGNTEGPDRSFSTRPTEPLFGACPNEALRQLGKGLGALLPDCRAYEQASPTNKDAGDLIGSIAITKTPPDGGAVSFASVSGVPGGRGAQGVPSYLARRGEGSWSTQGLQAPATLGELGQTVGWLPDFSKVYATAGHLTQHAAALFDYPGGTGEPITQLSPYAPEARYAFAGASADASKAIFEANADLGTTPAGLEGHPNVYAFDEEDKALSLASVLNTQAATEAALPKGAFAGPYDWSRGIGTTATGGPSHDYYTEQDHAVSADGSAFFTAAGSGQLYERLHPTAKQSALDGEGKCTEDKAACTLHLSASERGVPDPAGPRPAAFMGASKDGSLAYFTSPEKLTDEANTGPEGEAPAIGAAKLGAGEEKAEEVNEDFLTGHHAIGIASAGSHIYWADTVEGTIGRATLNGEGKVISAEDNFIEPGPTEATDEEEVEKPKGSGEFETVTEALTPPSKPRYVAVEGNHIFWTNIADGKDKHGTIGRATLNGEEVEDVRPACITGASNPQGIAANEENVYWGDDGERKGNEQYIARANLECGKVEQHFFHPQGGPNLYGVALTATHIYWAAVDGSHNSSVDRIPLGGAPENSDEGVFIGVGSEPRGIAVDGTHVYWAAQGEGAIGRVLTGEFKTASCATIPSCEKAFLKVNNGTLSGLALDGTGHLYWSVNGESTPNPGNDLYRYETETGTLKDLVPDQADEDGVEAQGVLAISEDGSRVYFAANGVPSGAQGSPNERGEEATPGNCKGPIVSAKGSCNLYLWEEGEGGEGEEGQLSFIARLQTGGNFYHNDAADWTGTPNGIYASGAFQNTSRLSADGKTLLFRSQHQLSAYENEGVPELYRYRAGEPIICVSCDPSGEAPVAPLVSTQGATLGSITPSFLLPTEPQAVLSRNLTDEGRRIFFETTAALLPADTNGAAGCPATGSIYQRYPACQDVYEWEEKGTGSCESESENGGCLYLLSTGKGPNPAFFGDASEDGKDAFILTRTSLVGQDGDELLDVYDVREEGGIAAQNQASPPPCEGAEGCREAAPQPPSEDSAGSASFEGPENPKSITKKPKKHKGKHHKKKKQKKGHRRARASSRAATTGIVQVPAQAQPSQQSTAQTPPTTSAPRRTAEGPGGTQPLSAAPAWKLTLTPTPANFTPGASAEYFLEATNVGAATTSGKITLELQLPVALTALKKAQGLNFDPNSNEAPECAPPAQIITCETEEAVRPGRIIAMRVQVKVAPATPEGTLSASATVSGGEGATTSTEAPAQVTANPLAFGFLLGTSAAATYEDGSPATLAGSHPNQLTLDFGFPTMNQGGGLTNSGHPRDMEIDLPRGLVGSLGAVPVLCTELELTSEESPDCRKESQVGVVDVTSLVLGNFAPISTPLYAMVPPPGAVAAFGTNVAEVGIFVHAVIGIRSDGDYGIEASTHDLLALAIHPIFNLQTQIWADPSAKSHDQNRGPCVLKGGSCPVEAQHTALLSMPGDCPGQAPSFEAGADSWEEPSPPAKESRTAAPLTDLAGNPAPTEGCGELEYEPRIAAKPTTNVADSPSGLEFELHQPQRSDLEHRAEASLKDATITFPAGMAVNPSQASGLGACDEAQIGYQPSGGQLHFSKQPQSCPDSAKLGTIEVSSPALVARNEAHEVEEDPETGEPIAEPLHGAIYLAKPFQNPFGSLIATYLVIEDEKTGIIAKLAGEGRLDPTSGQISVSFKENPELPLESFKAKLFGGPRGAFITPPVCGPYETSAKLTPWSAPEAPDANPSDSFQISAAPDGGPCPTAEAQMPHAPTFSGGTLTPAAGKFSPLLIKISREDGSQRLARIDALLPTGISAKLAGVGQCSEAEIAKARAREAPQQGAAEQADPSCPASSQIGTISASAGAGPTPYRAQGHVYLAGPYKGAPLSAVAIVPAVAGPFDLGVSVVRAALYLDPSTGQVRMLSDPLPQLLDGVPLDVRSVSVRVDRPNFALNPTSCDVKSFGGSLISALGQSAPIAQRFQAGGCGALPFKPKLSARLFGPTNRGAHPRLRLTLTAKPGEANIAALSFTLPHSEFIDQGHFRTICTRVQFAATQCPAGSVYGQVSATTPLLDYALGGPVYLRSSSHELPDAVAALRGPPSQPIEIDGDARIDSVGGRLRARVESLPDAPIEKVVVLMQGAKKGLFQNSTNVCRGAHRLAVSFVGQNGKTTQLRPLLQAQCKKRGR